jgi:Fur family ferric uptake transcriptional regulator
MRASSVDRAIVDTLTKEHSHMTSLQVFETIRERLPAVNQSTVYRALERLARHGTVSVSDMGTGSAVYEMLDQGFHHHLVCQQCSRVTELGHNEVMAFFSAVRAKHHFRIRTNHLILFGICEACSSVTNDRAEVSEDEDSGESQARGSDNRGLAPRRGLEPRTLRL